MLETLIEMLPAAEDSVAAMNIIHSSLRHDSNELISACNAVKSDLREIFAKAYPTVRIHVFGSMSTGTALRGKSNRARIATTVINVIKPKSNSVIHSISRQ